jgi:flagellar hook-length control protein FliK
MKGGDKKMNTPSVSVSSAQYTNAGNAASGKTMSEASFSSVLNEAQSDANNTATEQMAVMTMPVIHSVILLPSLSASSSPATVEQLAVQALNAIKENPAAAQGEIAQNADLRSWIMHAAKWLQDISSNDAAGRHRTLLSGFSGDARMTAEQIATLIEKFMGALKQNPNGSAVRELSTSFEAAFRSMLTAAGQPLDNAADISEAGRVTAGHPTSAETPHFSDTRMAHPRNFVYVETNRSVPLPGTFLSMEALSGFHSRSHVHAAIATQDTAAQPLPAVSEESSIVWTGQTGDPANKPMMTEVIKPAVSIPIQSQQFTEEMGTFLFKKWTLSEANGMTEAKLSLFPEHLGKVDVRITMQNGQMTAYFAAETLLGKDMIEHQLPQLRAALQNQGIQVDKLEVAHNSGVQSQLFHDQRQHQSPGQSWSRQNKNKGDNYGQTAVYAPEGERLDARRISVYGSSFEVTA